MSVAGESDVTALPGPSRRGVGAMFDRIADRYDLANRVLSFGLDRGWRKKLKALLQDAGSGGRKLRVLDVATGTGDLALELAKDPRVGEVVGVDISRGMLGHAARKLAAAPAAVPVRFDVGDATVLTGLTDFDVVTIAFGIRNVLDLSGALRAMHGALAPGGRLLILEFGEPTAPVFAPTYRWYRRHVLPRVGGALSGDTEAYGYLDKTIAAFPPPSALLAAMAAAGFDAPTATPLMLGAVTLYSGTRGTA